MKGIAHITGGSFTENIPRAFPEGLGAVICKDSWEVPPVFKWLPEVILLSITLPEKQYFSRKEVVYNFCFFINNLYILICSSNF